MSQTSLHDGTWRSVILRLSAVCDLEATARTFKAFERRGKVANATSLLRLILMYSVGRLSLRATAAAACGTVIKPPGAGGQWRVHARYDPGRGGFADLRLTPAGTAEATALTRLDAGQTVITDRGYARVRNIEAVLAAGSHVLTRIGWRWLALLTSLPAAAAPPARVVEMYRARWQVELSF